MYFHQFTALARVEIPLVAARARRSTKGIVTAAGTLPAASRSLFESDKPEAKTEGKKKTETVSYK